MLVDWLRFSGQLRVYRPETAIEFHSAHPGGWYVFEDLFATPVTMPLASKLRELHELSMPDAVTIWVSDPVELRKSSYARWEFPGAFVFLVEELGDFSWSKPYAITGISALRLIVDFLSTGQDYSKSVQGVAGSPDEFGRDSSKHPIQKLVEAGGYVGRSRIIESVYKIAYMSNEQAAEINGHEVRVCDILAYPLYISE